MASASSSSVVAPKNLSHWHQPSARDQVISDLIHGVDRYNPSNIGLMEDYLDQQIRDGTYDLFANLAILKLYQFNPQLNNPNVIVNILIKSLASTVNGPDFNLCLSLLREPTEILHDIESDDQSLVLIVPVLKHLHDLIRTCQFTEFWAAFGATNEANDILKNSFYPQHTDLALSFRTVFSQSITSCFSRIPLKRLERWLHLSSAELNQWCSSVEWEVQGDVAVIPKNGDNDVKAGVVKEHVELSQLTKLIATAAY